jgi:hypothetical protein
MTHLYAYFIIIIPLLATTKQIVVSDGVHTLFNFIKKVFLTLMQSVQVLTDFFLQQPSRCVVALTKMSFSPITTIYSIMCSLLHVSVTSNHHQADISVRGHDMFSAYSMGSHIVYICCVEFQTFR